MNIKEVPKSELTIINIIWESTEAMPSNAITQKAEELKGWKRTTTLTLLSILVEKGILERERRKNTVYYTAKIKKEDYTIYATKLFLETLFNGSAEELRKVLDKIEN